MNMLYMKINSFDEGSKSLLVSFASDSTKSTNPDDYPSYAFQPINMWPDISDAEEIMKRIAIAGVYHVEQQKREENLTEDSETLLRYRNMVGQLVSYPASDLSPPPEFPVQEV